MTNYCSGCRRCHTVFTGQLRQCTECGSTDIRIAGRGDTDSPDATGWVLIRGNVAPVPIATQESRS